jgi:hypothetical protein
MSQSDSVPSHPPPVDAARRAFLILLPVIRGIACSRFRTVRCPAQREELVAEAVGLGWQWCLRLVARGKDPAAFPVTLARLAARAAACGRRLTGEDRVRDVMSRACRRRHGFALVSVPAGSPAAGTELADALAGHAKAPVPAQVQFRLDFPAWLARLPALKRRVAGRLAVGHRTRDVAAEVGVTPARISQLRGELRHDYLNFLTRPPGE